MNDPDGFLQAILAEPDDDAHRLIYADWLEERGDPRGEFIRVQCELARRDEDDPRRPALRARERALLKKHEKVWAGPLTRLVPAWVFHRGFVWSVSAEPRQFVEHAAELFRLAPVRGVRFFNTVGQMHTLAACPHLDRLDTIDLTGRSWTTPETSDFSPFSSSTAETVYDVVGDVGLAHLVSSSYLSRLYWLVLNHAGITPGGLGMLAASPNLPRLAWLDLEGNGLGVDGTRALAVSPLLARLTRLNFGFNGLGDEGGRVLTSSGRLGRLTWLALDSNDISGEGLRALAKCSDLAGLTHLSLRNNRIGGTAFQAVGGLAASLLPGRAPLPLTAGVAAAVGSSYLARLGTLDLSKNYLGRKDKEALRARFGRRVRV